MLTHLLRMVGLPDSTRAVLRVLGLLFILLTAANVITISFAKALFIGHNDYAALPWMFIGAASFTAVATLIYVNLMGRWQLEHRFMGLLIVTIVSFGALGVLVPASPKKLSLFVFTWCSGMGNLLIIQAWGYSTTVLPVRTARRLFPVLAAAATLGAVGGGALTALIMPFGQLASLLIAAVLLLFGALVVVFRASKELQEAQSRPGREEHRGGAPRKPHSSKRGLSGIALAWKNLRTIPLIRHLAFLAFFLQIASVTMDFQFSSALKAKFETQDIATFLGGYYALANFLTFGVALVAGQRLARYLGIGVAAGSASLALVIGSVACLFLGQAALIWGVLITSFSERVVNFGIGKHAFNAALTPVDARAVERAKFIIDGVGLRVATIGVSLVFLLVEIPLDKIDLLSPFVLGTAVITFIIALRLTPTYRRTLVQAVRTNTIEPADSGTVKAWAQREAHAGILKLVNGENEQDIIEGLKVCEQLNIPVPSVCVGNLLMHRNAAVAARTLHTMANLKQPVDLELYSELLAPERPAELLRAALRHVPEERSGLQDRVTLLADHADPLVSCLSLIWLRPVRRREHLPSHKKNRMLTWTHVEQRIDGSVDAATLAAPVTQAIERLHDYLANLPKRLDDTNPAVRAEAADAMAALSIPSLVKPLLDLVDQARIGLVATSTLARMSEDLVVPHVASRLTNSQTGASHAIRLIHLAEQLNQAQLIGHQLDHAAETVRNATVEALWRLSRKPGIGMPDATTLLGQAIADVAMLTNYAQLDQLLRNGEGARIAFVRHEVGLRRQAAERRLFKLLGILYGRTRMLQVHTHCRSQYERTKSNAIEVLDDTLKDPGLKPLIGYIEATEFTEEGSFTSDATYLRKELSGISGTEDSLARILPGIDHKLSNLYRWATTPDDLRTDAEPMDRVFLLHSIPLFKGSTADQLLAISDICQEASFSAGEPIFSPGDEARFLYLIVQGRVEILREGRQVVVFGAKDCFGELAILDDASRNTAARALDDTDCLVLSREDFQGLLNISPDLAQGTISVLTRRLRSLLQKS